MGKRETGNGKWNGERVCGRKEECRPKQEWEKVIVGIVIEIENKTWGRKGGECGRKGKVRKWGW